MSDTADLFHRVDRATRRVAHRVGELTMLAAHRQEVLERLERNRAQLAVLDEVSAFLTSFAEEAQDVMRQRIEVIVTHALQTIFGDDLHFRLVPDVKARTSVLDFVIVSDMGGTTVETPVLGARGGGVAAVVGFILRLVVLLLTPGRRRVLVLDETFAQVSEEYEPRVAEFLREVVDKAGVQIILVTHSHAYTDVADKAYRFRLTDGVTQVEALTA